MVKQGEMVMEEFVHYIETPETSTMRINADVMNHIGTIFVQAEDAKMKELLFEMICKHSEFILDTSGKVIQNRRLGIKAVT